MNLTNARSSLPSFALCLAALLTLSACPKKGGGNAIEAGGNALGDCSPLAGVWMESEDIGQTTTIQCVSNKPAVVSVIDSDGEAFVVRRSGVENGRFTWDYNVPSTGYEVHIEVTSQEGDTLYTEWRNANADGTETLYRKN